MVRVLGVAVLFTLTIVQMENANANLCQGLSYWDVCGDDGRCVCANDNFITHYGNGPVNPCNNLVCRFPGCYLYTGRHAKPKKIQGEYVSCSSDEDCGNNFVCVVAGFCCPSLRLTYRFSWEKGSGPCGPSCNPADVGRQGSVANPKFSALKWVSRIGNTTNQINDVNYVMTSISTRRSTTGWEQGEGAVFIKGPFKQPFIVSLSNIPWIVSSDHTNITHFGYMETYVNTAIRNDTGLPNGSPYTSLPSYIGIPFECESKVKLPVEDPEIDNIRCRLARASECGGSCTNVPNGTLWLDSISCTFTIKAYQIAGYKKKSIYRLTLVAEDFPETTVTMGTKMFTRRDSLSRIPIQVTLRVIDGPCNKIDRKLEFVRPTLPNFSRSSFRMAEIIRHLPVATGFYLHTDGAYNISEVEIIMSGAMFFNYSYFPDDQRVTLNRSNVVRVGVNWRPHIPDQIGSQQYCVWGVDMFGITTDPRCVTSLVGDDEDHCAAGAVSCENNGKCINIFKVPEEKCKCTPGYKSKNCSQVVRCVDKPCENNGTCTDEPNGFKCDCKSDYTGIMCESKVQPCGSNPCRNGGICLDMQNAFMCLCASTYAGEMCEQFQPQQSEHAADDTFLSWILPIAIASAAAVALVTGSCLFLTGVYKKSPKNKTQVKPNDHEVCRVSMSEITPVEEW